MATRKKTAKRSTLGSRLHDARQRATAAQSAMFDGVQQIWLAGMGAVSKAQSDGPAAFQDAVAEGLKLLGKSRANAEKMVRDALDTAQGSVQTRLEGAREQANETWDNLEALFQSRVQRALQQIGVPTADEIRLLTRRVAELNDTVKTLSAGRAGKATGRSAKPRTVRKPVRKTVQKTARQTVRKSAVVRRAKAK